MESPPAIERAHRTGKDKKPDGTSKPRTVVCTDSTIGRKEKNNALHGYNLLSQPSRSAAGDVAFYTGKSLNAVKRTDLSVTDEEFETVWVEIKNIKSTSTLCCCA